MCFDHVLNTTVIIGLKLVGYIRQSYELLIIDCTAGYIMRSVVSVCPFVCALLFGKQCKKMLPMDFSCIALNYLPIYS